jgi:alpha-tubulin suppressor-like RCC1 family protein
MHVQFSLTAYPPSIHFLLAGQPSVGLTLNANAGFSCTLDDPLKLTIFVPGTPLVVTLQPHVDISATGKVNVTLTWSPRLAIGFDRGPGVSQNVYGFGGSATSISASLAAHAEAWFAGDLGVSLAGRVGVTGSFGPDVTADLNASSGTASTCVDVGRALKAELKAFADVFFKHWSFTLASGTFEKAPLYQNCTSSGGGGGAPSITTTSLPAGTVGAAYSQTLQGSGGSPPYTWSITAGSLPSGLSLSSSGVVAGTPMAAGTSSFTVRLTDAASNQVQRAFTMQVTGLSNAIATAVSVGNGSCALTSSDGVRCWGPWNISGPGGAIPVDVPGLTSGVSAISVGGSESCVLTSGGGVKCWGDNSEGALGDGTMTSSSTPVNVVGLTSGAAAISAGWEHACALTTSGGVKCWGFNGDGELGDGTTTTSSTPVNVVGLTSGVVALSAGGYHTCALTSGGAVKCWGYNVFGQLGDGTTTDSSTPVDVVGLGSGVDAISAGTWHTCALTSAGGVKCWGPNGDGQLGDGTNTSSSTPVDVAGLSNGVAEISTGTSDSCALTDSGGVKCWGYNADGQLGDGTVASSSMPMDVIGLSSGATAIAVGGLHVCSLISGGGVECWGEGLGGELGDGMMTSSTTPVNVIGFG